MPALHVAVCSDAAHKYVPVSYRIHVVPYPGVIHVIQYWNDTVWDLIVQIQESISDVFMR
jgi:hypothetical protein